MRKKLDYEYCSASPILEWLGDKWAFSCLVEATREWGNTFQ